MWHYSWQSVPSIFYRDEQVYFPPSQGYSQEGLEKIRTNADTSLLKEKEEKWQLKKKTSEKLDHILCCDVTSKNVENIGFASLLMTIRLCKKSQKLVPNRDHSHLGPQKFVNIKL